MCLDKIIKKFNTFGIITHMPPNAIGLWQDEQRLLVWCALQSEPGNWLEIGSFCGGSTILLCLAKQTLQDTYKVISVDRKFNSLFDHNVYNRGKFHSIHQKVQTDSSILLKSLPENAPISFAFIDGFHSFRQVVKDFTEISHLFTTDPTIVFHDTSPFLYDNGYLEECLAKTNVEYLLENDNEDFYIDEAIAYICREYNYELMDIPINKDETHYIETGLQEWIRGKTSPFNGIAAIRKKK